MSQYTLHYFQLHMRGDPIRALLSHAEIPFEDKRAEILDWPNVKPLMPGGQLPCLELSDGLKMGQTNAILRYLGKKYGYYPSDPLKAYKMDYIIDVYEDVIKKA